MNRKKGFTLIELLAIVVVLAVAALVTTPMIIGVIENTKKKALESSADGITESIRMSNAGDEYAADSFTIQDGTIKKSNGTLVKKTGGSSENGTASIDEAGNITMSISNGTWCATKEATSNKIVISKYNKQTCKYIPSDNLFTNGDGAYGYNLNFSQLTFVKEGDKGYFSRSSAYNLDVVSDELIPVDTQSTYIETAEVKASNTTATFYMGIAEYDIDKRLIGAPHIMWIPNSTTTLTQDLNNGDTVIYLNDLTNFIGTSATPDYQRGLILWNYKDSTGYQYPAETYSRNVWFNLYDYTAIDKTAKKITLKSPWRNGKVVAGTSLSQSSSGGSYNYGLMAGRPLTNSWQTYTNTISSNSFRKGTKYIKFLSLDNYNNTPGTISYYRNLTIKKT